MLIATGTVLEGKYRIDRLLGAGGMGSVWIGEHMLLHRPVAVKVLDAGANKDGTAIQRFLREAQTAARLRSDHIVDVMDVGRFENGTPYIIMELLEGETLAARIRRIGRLPQSEGANLVDQLLNGLGAAHAAGVIHRDIKPDNCFLITKNGRDHLKLLDFGISKVAGDAREMRMTKTGVVMGTPYYMAPEQARGAKEIDHRCDLYACGAILFECVTGRVPFEAESVNELLFKIVLEEIPTPSTFAPELDAEFERLILQAMSREASDRFATAQAFRDALASYVVPTSRGSGERVVIRSNPPPPMSGTEGSSQQRGGPGSIPISGNEATAPIDDALRAAVMAQSAYSAPPLPASLPVSLSHGSRPTPSGLMGLSATGPLHISSPPGTRRSVGVITAASLGALLIIGGAVYLATATPATRTGEATGSAASANEEFGTARTQTSTSEKTELKQVGSGMQESSPPSATTTSTSSSAKTDSSTGTGTGKTATKAAPTSPPTTAATIGKTKPTSAAPTGTLVLTPPTSTTPPALTTVPPPKGSPRPIDTAL